MEGDDAKGNAATVVEAMSQQGRRGRGGAGEGRAQKVASAQLTADKGGRSAADRQASQRGASFGPEVRACRGEHGCSRWPVGWGGEMRGGRGVGLWQRAISSS